MATATDWWGLASSLTQFVGSILLATEVFLFFREGPAGPYGGQAAQRLRDYYASRAAFKHKLAAWLGLGLVLFGMMVDVVLSVVEVRG